MYSLETLRYVNDKATLESYLKEHPLTELKVTEDVKRSPDYALVDIQLLEKVAGVKLVEEFFVALSELDTGPAIRFSVFEHKLKAILAKAEEAQDTIYSCLTGIGQFQVHVGIFKKVKS
jgi:hypothetical protein